ncbi:MAG: hypothetical protein AAGJ35_03920 [Myxococcota bacterium]
MNSQANPTNQEGIPWGRLRGLALRMLQRWKLWLSLVLALQLIAVVIYKIFKKDTYIHRATVMYVGDQLNDRKEKIPSPKVGTLLAMVKTFPRIERMKKSLQLQGSVMGLAQQVHVKQMGRSRVLEILLHAPSKTEGQRRLNWFTRDLLKRTHSFWKTNLAQRKEAFEKALRQRKQELEQTRKALSKLQRDTGYMGKTSSLAGVLSSNARFRQRWYDAQVRLQGLKVEIRTLQRSLKRIPKQLMLKEIQQNPLAKQYAEIVAKHRALQRTLTPKHPKMRMLSHQIRALRAQMTRKNMSDFSVKTRGSNPIFQKLYETYLLKVSERDSLRRRLRSLKRKLGRQNKRQKGLPVIAQKHEALELRKATLEKIVSKLEVSYAEILTDYNAQRSPIKLIEGAHFFTVQAQRRRKLMLLGFLAGLPLLVFGLLLVHALRDPVLRYASDLEDLDVPTLGPIRRTMDLESLSALQLYVASFPRIALITMNTSPPSEQLEFLHQKLLGFQPSLSLELTSPYFVNNQPQSYHFQAKYGHLEGRILWVQLGVDTLHQIQTAIQQLRYEDRLLLLYHDPKKQNNNPSTNKPRKMKPRDTRLTQTYEAVKLSPYHETPPSLR